MLAITRKSFFKQGNFLPHKFRKNLENIFSKDTAYNPDEYTKSKVESHGHCYTVSKLIKHLFKTNEFYITRNHDNTHWFYKIDGCFFDFTSDQYGGDGIYPLDNDLKNKKRQNLMPQDSDRVELFIDRFLETIQL